MGESSSPHTFTRRRFQPFSSVTDVAMRSESSDRYFVSLSTSAPFHQMRSAPALPVQMEMGLTGVFVFSLRESRTKVDA